MELKQQQVWMVVRIRRHDHEPNIEALHAYLTEEEAKEKLRMYAGCLGEFDVIPTQTWFPSFH